MTRFTLSMMALAFLSLMACQSETAEPDELSSEIDAVIATEDFIPTANMVRLRLQPPVSEPRACILPIRVENGLEASVNVTMIGFGVSGPGGETTGNMFAPVADPGDVSEARVILEGQSCDAYDTLDVSEVRCTAEGEDCSDEIELTDGAELRFAQAG